MRGRLAKVFWIVFLGWILFLFTLSFSLLLLQTPSLIAFLNDQPLLLLLYFGILPLLALIFIVSTYGIIKAIKIELKESKEAEEK